MKFKPSLLAALLVCSAPVVLAQDIDLGPGVTPLQKFRLYPRLHKGFDALQRGDGARAISEFEQAHRLAPGNPVVALHLADAYRRFGQPARAMALLRSQLKLHPGHRGLQQALANLETKEKSASTFAAPPTPRDTAPAAASADSGSAPSVSPPAARHDAVRPATSGKRTPSPRSAPPSAEARRPAVAGADGYRDAQEAYALSRRGEHALAAERAASAVQAAPDNFGYRRLRVYELMAAGQLEQAQREADLAAGHPTAARDAEWDRLLAALRQQQSAATALQAARSAETGDLAGAQALAQQSVERDPAGAAQRLLWLGTLLQAQQWAQAEAAAQDGLQRGEEARLRALQAVAIQAQGRTDEAAQAFDVALGDPSPGLTVAERTNLRLIAIDGALAAGDRSRATGLLVPLQASEEPAVLSRRAALEQAGGRALNPASMPSASASTPVVRCFGTPAAIGCQVWPGQDAPDAGSQPAQQAYQAYAERQYAVAAEQAGEAVRFNPGHAPYRLLRLDALAADGRADEAIGEAGAYLQSHPESPEILALRSRLLERAGRHAEAQADAQRALAMGGLSLSSEVGLLLQEQRRDEAARQFALAMQSPNLRDSADPDVAYLAMRVGDDDTALAVFDRAQAQGRLPASSLQDAAYVASRLAQNERSVGYFKQAIDAADAGTLALTPQRRFETRREIADRDRSWGLNALVAYRGMPPGATAFIPAQYGDVAQMVTEAYWRPQGFRDGSFWELYGAYSRTLYAKSSGPTGERTSEGALGVRAKPLRDHNLVLALEGRFKIGELTRNDWLVRAGYSGGFGTDLRVDTPQWTTVNVFAEAGRFLKAKRNYVVIEAQAGRSFRMGDADARLVLFPHVVGGLDYNSLRTAAGYNGAAGLGFGLGVRYWFREDQYHAPRSYVDFSVQHRWRLAGDERGKGWFLRAALVY